MFKGRPAKVIAFMITIISVGGIFFKFGQDTTKLVTTFNGVAGFILILFVSLAVIGGGYAYAFPKDESKKKKQLTQTVIMSWAIWIGVSILLPVFGNVFEVVSKGSTTVLNSAHATASFIYNTLSIIEILSYVVAVVSLIVFGFELFSFGVDSLARTIKSSKPDKKEKEIKEVKKLLKSIINELKGTNDHFNNKVNLLNEIRRRTGNLRRRGSR